MAPTPFSMLVLLAFATASVADRVPFYLRATPTSTGPNLQARQTSSTGEDSNPVVASCSTAIESFLSVAPQAPEDLNSWLEENRSGKCGDIPTTNIPASLTSALSSLQSHGSSLNCQHSSLVEAVWSTCAELPQFSDHFEPIPEGCNSFQCPGGGDGESDEGGDSSEGNSDSGDDNGAASSLMGMGAAAAAVVAGSIAFAAFQL
ncbi:uncharacterized protein DNG_04326 [Cephalotrichum gorgonifer]|uniref:Infection structure specific protein n=1 Tax=Cephalotrichum gorgonifer TaxID=2041049 RepID=A0AAE8MWW0_9PEZI|nr:uncharacterized protein DNG_04326 [Cephalotrichum gorgonifer]